MPVPIVSGLLTGALVYLATRLDKGLDALFEADHNAKKYPSSEPPCDPHSELKEAALRSLVYSLPANGLIAWHLLTRRPPQGDVLRVARDRVEEAFQADMAPFKAPSSRESTLPWFLAKIAMWAAGGAALRAFRASRRSRAAARQDKVGVSSLHEAAALKDVEAGAEETAIVLSPAQAPVSPLAPKGGEIQIDEKDLVKAAGRLLALEASAVALKLASVPEGDLVVTTPELASMVAGKYVAAGGREEKELIQKLDKLAISNGPDCTSIDIGMGEYDIESEYDEARWRHAGDAWVTARRA